MVDEPDDRWSVRGIPKAMQDQVKRASGRAGISVGEWFSRAFDRALQAEREPIDVIGPRVPSDKVSDRSLDALSIVERVVNAAATLANAEAVPRNLRGRANRALREMLPGDVTVSSSRNPALPPPRAAVAVSNGHATGDG